MVMEYQRFQWTAKRVTISRKGFIFVYNYLGTTDT